MAITKEEKDAETEPSKPPTNPKQLHAKDPYSLKTIYSYDISKAVYQMLP